MVDTVLKLIFKILYSIISKLDIMYTRHTMLKKPKRCPFCGESKDLAMRNIETDFGKCSYIECLPCDAEGIKCYEEEYKFLISNYYNIENSQQGALFYWNKRYSILDKWFGDLVHILYDKCEKYNNG